MTFFVMLPAKDRTGAARQRRYRQNRKARTRALQKAPAGLPGGETVTLMKCEIRGLAHSMVRGEADRRDTLIAAALIMQLIRPLPPEGDITVSLAR